MNEDILKIILAIYYFDKKITDIKLEQYVEHFYKNFKFKLTSGELQYEINKFKIVDPSYHSIIQNENAYKKIWDYYITKDRIVSLKNIFNDFKNDSLKLEQNNLIDYTSDEKSILSSEDFNRYFFDFIEDIPINKNIYKTDNLISQEKRSRKVLMNAYQLCNNKCEYDENHISFERKDEKGIYLEGHHLIPLSKQENFEYSLDVEANIVLLCSNCHNCLHYGKNGKSILEKLYNNRKDRLEKCNLFIDLNDLYNYY